MTRIAFLFPGQNSQQVGMGRSLAQQVPTIREQYFDRANDILGFDLARLLFEGPEEDLVRTENQQPAIYVVSVALLAALRQAGVEAEAVAGHSLGEYAALTAAGSIPFTEGVHLTRRRGELMAEVGARSGGIMAAILGLSPGTVDLICRQAQSEGVVEVANFNSPTQTVISGTEPGVRRAMSLAREEGAARVIELNVSAPFHCSLMAPLAQAFAPVLDTAPITAPALPVIANVTAAPEHTPGEIRHNLIAQLASSVLWTDSVQRLIADGYDTFIEVGPGKVLTGLMRQIDRRVTARSTGDLDGVRAVAAFLQGEERSSSA